MSTCKRCGCEFDYDLKRGTGYAPDMCGSYCDGVYHERQVGALKIAGLMKQIDQLRAERDALATELARLRRLEEALPKTADGVPIVPGMIVYSEMLIGGQWEVTGFNTRRGELSCLYSSDGFDAICSGYYSTREAAELAREAEKARQQ